MLDPFMLLPAIAIVLMSTTWRYAMIAAAITGTMLGLLLRVLAGFGSLDGLERATFGSPPGPRRRRLVAVNDGRRCVDQTRRDGDPVATDAIPSKTG